MPGLDKEVHGAVEPLCVSAESVWQKCYLVFSLFTYLKLLDCAHLDCVNLDSGLGVCSWDKYLLWIPKASAFWFMHT